MAQGFALRGRSVAKSPKVSRSKATTNSRGCVEDLDIRCKCLAVRYTCFGVAVQDFVYIQCCMY